MKPETRVGRKSRDPWFAVRRELSPRRASALTALSFVLPLLVWSAVSYLPFLWHPDIRLEVSADREGVTPLAHARRRGFADIAGILERAGAR